MTAHSTRSHARLAPSAAYRWSVCPGSVRLSKDVPNKSSVFADEGTAAHTLVEVCLSQKLDAADFAGGHVNIKTGKVHREEGEGDGIFEITDEMVDAVQLYVDTVRGLVDDGDEVEFEAKLDLRHIPGMDFGTGDTIIYKPKAREIIVPDFKYGRGVPVEAKGNSQLRAYMLGAVRRYHNCGIDTVRGIIVQPRCPHREGPVREEVLDVLDVLEFRMDLEEAALATMEDDAPLVPGDHCKFCPAAPFCPALKQRALEVASMEFSDEPPPVGEMTGEEIAAVFRQAEVVEGWVKRVKERAHQMALDGDPPTGFKLVASRATRKWKDEHQAIASLTMVSGLAEEDLYAPPKMLSPAGVAKLLGAKRKNEIADLVVAKSSGTILVSEDDPRPVAKALAEEEFA